MNAQSVVLEAATIRQQCKLLIAGPTAMLVGALTQLGFSIVLGILFTLFVSRGTSTSRAEQALEVVAQINGVENIRNDLTYPGSAAAPEPSLSPEAKIPSALAEPKVAEDPTAPVERIAPPPAER